jgi:uncharacterized membrane protein
MLLLLRVLGGLIGTAMLIGAVAILLLGSDDLWIRVVYSLAWLGGSFVFLRYAATGQRGASLRALWRRNP